MITLLEPLEVSDKDRLAFFCCRSCTTNHENEEQNRLDTRCSRLDWEQRCRWVNKDDQDCLPSSTSLLNRRKGVVNMFWDKEVDELDFEQPQVLLEILQIATWNHWENVESWAWRIILIISLLALFSGSAGLIVGHPFDTTKVRQGLSDIGVLPRNLFGKILSWESYATLQQ